MPEPSGAQWCARYPTSTSVADLIEPFRSNAIAFINALRGAGASVAVSATYRPAERAYLMHWCCMIARSGQDVHTIPPMAGVAIDWTHGGDIQAAKDAARAMMRGYDIAYPAALQSRHTQRRAIDMTVRGPWPLRIETHNGGSMVAAAQGDLVPIGLTYGVHKLLSDPPHWSDDGH